MDMEIILSLVKPELLIIIAVCYVLGMFLKAIPKVADWVIPFVLLVFAIVMTILYMAIVGELGFTPKVILEGFIQGLLCAALAVYGNQLIKQLHKRE